MKGVLSWSWCPQTRTTASHSTAAGPSRSSLAELTVVFHLMCQGKCFCQDVSDRTHKHNMVPAGHQKYVNAVSLLNFPTGRGYGRYPSEGVRHHDECSGFTRVHG